VSYCKTKTRHLANVSIENFLLEHPKIYWWTFTEPGKNPDGTERTLWAKSEAEKALRPLLDLLRRRGISYLVVWELQRRLSWHPHVLTAGDRLDVTWLRPWMMKRGWGQQMKVVYLKGGAGEKFSSLPMSVRIQQETVRGYLQKSLRRYLLKARTDDAVEPRKKFFGGSRGSRDKQTGAWRPGLAPAVAGNIKFAWNPWTDTAHAYLYSRGRSLFFQLHESCPGFRDIGYIMRLGYEDTGWRDVDFLYVPPYQGGYLASPPG
jgi:hypothetical protein